MSRSPFEGDLIRLRAREPEDEADVFRWMADPDVVLFNIVRYPRSRAAVRERIAAGAEISYNHARFAIETRDEGKLIGDIAIHVEEPESRCGWIAMTIGDPEYRAKGYGTDSLRTLCRFGFDMMNLNRIELEVLGENERAIRAYTRVGFQVEGRRRNAVYTHGRYIDLVVMGMLREELSSVPGRQPPRLNHRPASLMARAEAPVIDAVGWLAVVLTQVFYVPNTLKILRTKNVQGYSLFGWSLLTAGLTCYFIYFLAQGDPVGIVANVCGVAGAGLTTFCIWLWRGNGLSVSVAVETPPIEATGSRYSL